MATNLVGLILIPTNCQSKPAARTSGTACSIGLKSNNSNQDFWKTASPQHAQCDCHHLFRKVSGIFPGTCPIPWNFWNSGLLPKFNSRPNHIPNILPELAHNFQNLPRFPELSRKRLKMLLRFLPNSFQDVTRAEPTQTFWQKVGTRNTVSMRYPSRRLLSSARCTGVLSFFSRRSW